MVHSICIIKSQPSTDILEDRMIAGFRAKIAFMHTALLCTTAATVLMSNNTAT